MERNLNTVMSVLLSLTLFGLTGCGAIGASDASELKTESDSSASAMSGITPGLNERSPEISVGDIGLSGDVNTDGVFDKQDIAMVQDWLLAKPDATLNNWRAADVCQDERIDVFDVCILRRMLLSSAAENIAELPPVSQGETAAEKSLYTDRNGDTAVIPAQFTVSANEDEQTISQGLVVIAPDGSEYVWIPTTVTPLAIREFGSYFSGSGSVSDYNDETELAEYQKMAESVEKYGGFYIGRYEASKGEDGLPASRRISENDTAKIWVQFSPQDTTLICEQLYAYNDTIQGFFPWGANWDTMLQWLVDSGSKTFEDVATDSTDWGNYSDDNFSEGARGNTIGQWEEAKSNNIYDLAGNNWEWTQERCGSSYVMRGGGYNLMGGECSGARYPAALRDPLPGNNHHPNVTFRTALYVV